MNRIEELEKESEGLRKELKSIRKEIASKDIGTDEWHELGCKYRKLFLKYMDVDEEIFGEMDRPENDACLFYDDGDQWVTLATPEQKKEIAKMKAEFEKNFRKWAKDKKDESFDKDFRFFVGNGKYGAN